MVYKDTKPSEKGGEERESYTNKRRTTSSNERRPRSRLKTNNEQPASLGALRYLGKNMDDPQVKLKLLQLTPRNAAEETSTGVQEFVKHVTNIIRDTKYPFAENNSQRGKRFFVKNEEMQKNKNNERLARRTDDLLKNGSAEAIKPQKVSSPRRLTEHKSRSPKIDSPGRRSDGKNVIGIGERKKNRDEHVNKPEEGKVESQQKALSDDPKKENPKNQASNESANRKRLRPSEIPLLKNRSNLGKKTEIVNLLMKKPLMDNESTTSIDFFQNGKHDPLDKFNADLVNGETAKQMGETSLRAKEILKSSSADSERPDTSAGERKSPRGNKAKILDLERMKTSSFTVLRTESDSFSRLKTFHKKNLTAKEIARAETAIKASKMTIKASKTSFTSVHSKRNCTLKRSKSIVKKKKKTRNASQENKKSAKTSVTPYLDICNEIIRTGKVGCLIPTRVANKEDNKVKPDDNSSLPSPKSPEEKILSKVITKGPVRDKENFKRFKYDQNSEKIQNNNSVPVKDKPAVPSAGAIKKFIRKKSEDELKESSSNNSEPGKKNRPEKALVDERQLSARDLASLVVTGTALNFDEIRDGEKPPEVDKIKLEIKIDVPSEEDTSDSDGIECVSSGNISGVSVDWLLKAQNNEKQVDGTTEQKDKVPEEKLTSLFMEEFPTSEWEQGESSLQKPHRSLSLIRARPNDVSTVATKNASENKSEAISGDSFKCSLFFHNETKQDTKTRSGLTRISNTDEKLFEDLTALKLKRRNSEPHSMKGFIWKRTDVNSPKSLKPSMSSVASSLKHLNTDEMDDFIFWEAVPQKLTSCWEMSLYHFKRPWSVLSCSVFKDNRRSNTPGLILETLRCGGVTNLRRPVVYQNDRLNNHKGNIFDVEPSISQKNIDIRNWLAALNFTSPVSNSSDTINEYPGSSSSVMDTQKQENFLCRNVVPQLRLPGKVTERRRHEDKHHKFDKWYISEMDDLKELIRRESGSYVTREKHVFPDLTSPKSTVSTSTRHYASIPEKSGLKEKGDRNTRREELTVEKVESSCQSDPPTGDQMLLRETPAPLVGPFKIESVDIPQDINVWKYLFFFTLMFIIFHYSVGNNVVMRS